MVFILLCYRRNDMDYSEFSLLYTYACFCFQSERAAPVISPACPIITLFANSSLFSDARRL